MTEEKTHWKKQFNYKYLGSQDFAKGQEAILTIQETKHEDVKDQNGKDGLCFVAYFKEKDAKPMVLNKTNCKIIGKLHGNYIEDWAGIRIQIYVASGVKAFGDTVDALRVRNFIPADNAKLIDQIKACKTTDEIAKIYEANKALWSGSVKAAGLERNAQIKAGK